MSAGAERGDSALPLVLCIEADTDNLELLARVLESTGRYRVASASQPTRGIELARRRLPAAALVDLDLPVLDGFEVCRRLKADPTTRAIPLIALSASFMKGERRQALELGFAEFVEKPFDIHQLRDLVDELCHQLNKVR